MVAILLYLFFCVGHLVASRNWYSLNASLKRSHAIPDGLKLFREWKNDYMWSTMMLLRCGVIPGLTGYLVLYVMYRWSMLLGNGSYDLFPGSLNIAMK